MGVGKAILLIFGVIVLLVGVGLLFGGGFLVWADTALKDSEGFISTNTVQLERDSYAIVTPPADIDLKAAWTWDLSELATIKVEGESRDPSKAIFMGIGDDLDVSTYLSGVNHDEITRFTIHPYTVEYRNRPGNAEPSDPTAQTFWTASAHGAGTQALTWELEAGDWVLVLMNEDGSVGVDLDAAVGAKVPWIFGVGVGLLVGGVVVIAISVLMIYLAVRR